MHKHVKEKMRFTDKKIEHATDIGKMLKKSVSSINEIQKIDGMRVEKLN